MTIENTLDRINELKNIKNEYYNNKIEYFVEKTCSGYIVGYKYFNGYRIVNVYLKTLYAGRVLYTLDNIHAKHYTTKQAAAMAHDRMIEYNNNNPDKIRTN